MIKKLVVCNLISKQLQGGGTIYNFRFRYQQKILSMQKKE